MKLKILEKKIAKYKLLEFISLLMICWSIYQLFLYGNSISGDAEIHIIYAKNFVNGHFLEFNPGYKTGGESSFLYFLIVSLIYKFFGIYTLYLMKIISLLSFFWIFYKVYDINPSKSICVKLIGASTLSVIGVISHLATLGMENIFFAAILISFLSNEIKSNMRCENKTIILKSILLFLLRPEGLAYPLFLIIKSFFYKNKKLLISSLLAFLWCGISYIILSLISGGDFHNAGSIRRYISTLPITNIHNINLNLLGYDLTIGIEIFRKLIFTYPLIFGLILFRKYLVRTDQIITIVFIILPLFLHLFGFLPSAQFERYFIYGYCLIFIIFSARIIPKSSIVFVAFLGVLYLSGSVYAGLVHNHKFLKCIDSDLECKSKNILWDHIQSTSTESVKNNSDKLFKELANNENDIIDIGTTEVQIRNYLDERFRVWSLDGIVDRDLKKFKGKDFINHFNYIDYRNIDYLADLPNFNKSKKYSSLNDFAIDLNKFNPTYCTFTVNNSKVKGEECYIKTKDKITSKCIKNKKLSKTNVRSWYLNLGGWNGGWLWQVEKCE